MNTSSTVGQKRTNSDSNESQNIKKNKTTHFQPQQVELKNKLKKSEDAYNELNKYKNSLVEELGEKTTNLNNLEKQVQKMKKENDDLKEKFLTSKKDFLNVISTSQLIQAKYEALGRRFQDMERIKNDFQKKLEEKTSQDTTSNENALKKENDDLKKNLLKVQQEYQQSLVKVRLSAKNALLIHVKKNDNLTEKLSKAEAMTESYKKKLMALVNLD